MHLASTSANSARVRLGRIARATTHAGGAAGFLCGWCFAHVLPVQLVPRSCPPAPQRRSLLSWVLRPFRRQWRRHGLLFWVDAGRLLRPARVSQPWPRAQGRCFRQSNLHLFHQRATSVLPDYSAENALLVFAATAFASVLVWACLLWSVRSGGSNPAPLSSSLKCTVFIPLAGTAAFLVGTLQFSL